MLLDKAPDNPAKTKKSAPRTDFPRICWVRARCIISRRLAPHIFKVEPGLQRPTESRSAQAFATFCSPEELKWQSSNRSKSPSKASELTPLLKLEPGSGSASWARATGLSAEWK